MTGLKQIKKHLIQVFCLSPGAGLADPACTVLSKKFKSLKGEAVIYMDCSESFNRCIITGAYLIVMWLGFS